MRFGSGKRFSKYNSSRCGTSGEEISRTLAVASFGAFVAIGMPMPGATISCSIRYFVACAGTSYVVVDISGGNLTGYYQTSAANTRGFRGSVL